MRPGKVLWSRKDAAHEAQVVLVEEAYGSVRQPFVGFNEPEMTHVLKWAATTAAQFEALLAELAEAGSLSPEALERVKVAGEGALRRRLWDLREVDDLDVFN
jgi:hypothetical protein